MNRFCKTCGITTDSPYGGHGCRAFPIGEESVGYWAILECCSCRSKVQLDIAREQGLENWFVFGTTGAIFCTGCSHGLGLVGTTTVCNKVTENPVVTKGSFKMAVRNGGRNIKANSPLMDS